MRRDGGARGRERRSFGRRHGIVRRESAVGRLPQEVSGGVQSVGRSPCGWQGRGSARPALVSLVALDGCAATAGRGPDGIGRMHQALVKRLLPARGRDRDFFGEAGWWLSGAEVCRGTASTRSRSVKGGPGTIPCVVECGARRRRTWPGEKVLRSAPGDRAKGAKGERREAPPSGSHRPPRGPMDGVRRPNVCRRR